MNHVLHVIVQVLENAFALQVLDRKKSSVERDPDLVED
jgi:hypothetical protein